MNHGFVQGNKRTAYALLEWFVRENKLGAIHATDEAIVDFCLRSENEKWSIDPIDVWLRNAISSV